MNVLIWFSINLAIDKNGKPTITNGPDLDCASKIITKLHEMNLPTTHLISIGGWNSPHPDTSNHVEDVYTAWKQWNNGLFDGFDWDIEGNDDFDSPYNHFTSACLDLMGRMSQLAKQDGFIVTMAPAESYLDPTCSVFDYDLNHTYSEWDVIQPGFKYHGHNTYAYLLAKYGSTTLKPNTPATTDTIAQPSPKHTAEISRESASAAVTCVDTFDLVIIQLYEGYSHAEYQLTRLKRPPYDYFHHYLISLYQGWSVIFPTDIEFDEIGHNYEGNSGHRLIKIDRNKLVIGLANGWAGDGKFLLLYPDEVSILYNMLLIYL